MVYRILLNVHNGFFPTCIFSALPRYKLRHSLISNRHIVEIKSQSTIFKKLSSLSSFTFDKAACALLRSRKFLYSIFYSYKEQDVEKIINDKILHDTENLHSAFTLFYSKIGSFTEPSSVYQYILQTRDSQIFKTIPFDIIHDNY